MNACPTARNGDRFSEASRSNRFYGKYRGTVINNIDPLGIGRLLVMVPDVSALIPTSWAMPCVPIGGIQAGFYAPPAIGSGVWIEFEQGDPDYPIWVGCFWGSMAEVPVFARTVLPAVPGITMQTPLQNAIQVSDMPPTPLTGGIILKSATGAMIVVNDTGIFIQNGKGASLFMVGPAVNVNNGALVVM